MFVGHYAVCLAIKSYERKTSLGMLFISVQLLDLLFFSLALTGIESFSLHEHYLAASHLKFNQFHWSHSLVASLVWSVTAYCIFMYLIPIRGSKAHRVAFLMALAVFSHWVFDFISHTPDLPLVGNNSKKLGLGLWNSAMLTWLLESIMLIVALMFYIKSTRVRRKKGRHAMAILVIVMLIVNTAYIYGPLVHTSEVNFSITALFIFISLAWLASRFEQYRA